MLDLLVLTVQSSTYELHERLLCEIIERHKVLLLIFFYRMTALCVTNDNECEIPIITLLILITYIGHLFAFKF